MRRIGRPSEIYRPLREGRCHVCGAWIRLEAALAAHYEVEHPMVLPAREEIVIREIPIAVRMAALVEAGAPYNAAAAACGIPQSTFERWMRWGQTSEEDAGLELAEEEIPENRRIFWRFRRALTLAREASKVHRVRRIDKAAILDWRADAWVLERSFPSEFGRIDRVRLGGDPDAEPVRVVHEEEDPGFVEEVMRIYREQGVVPGVDSTPQKRPRAKRTPRKKKEA